MNTQYASPSGDKVFTIPEAAAYLKISKSKIYCLVARKEIPHLKVGRNVRIWESDLQNWLELQVEKVPAIFQDFVTEK